MLKKSHKKVRSKIYVGVAARANRQSGYEIRIFPAGRNYKLLQNGDQIVGGKSKAISALDERNKIRLAVEGRSVVAKVNGKRVASFEDDSPEQVVGRKTALIFGSMAKANKDGFGLFDSGQGLRPQSLGPEPPGPGPGARGPPDGTCGSRNLWSSLGLPAPRAPIE